MPNLRELENAMPVAPLKLVALPSARNMGEVINKHLVEFRKSIHNDKVKNDPAFHGYIEDNYLTHLELPVSEAVKPKPVSVNPSAEKTFSFWWMYVITVSPMNSLAIPTICLLMIIIRI